MARPRRVPVRTEAEITRDAIAELQAQMQNITAALQNLNVQRNAPPPPVGDPANDQADGTDGEEDDDANLFTDNPFAPLQNNRAIAREAVLGADEGFAWEKGFKTEIPEFFGNSSAEELLDWIVTVEEILEFIRAPMDCCVPLITMRFRNRAAAWWTQLKSTRARLGKPKVMSWDKLKSKLKKTFLPYNYDQIMFQRLHTIRQGTRSVAEYSTEFFFLLTRVDIQDLERQVVARFTAGLRQQIQHTITLFNPLTLAEAHQQALTLESQTRGNFSLTTSRSTRPTQQQQTANPTDDMLPQQQDTAIVPFTDKIVPRPSSLRCFTCGEIGHRQSNCPKRNHRGLLIDATGNDIEVVYDEEVTETIEETEDLVADHGLCLMVRRVCLAPRHTDETPPRHNQFHSKCTIAGKVCKFIIDSSSSENMIAEDVVNKLKLAT